MFKVVTKWSITFSLPICMVTTVFSPYLLGIAGSAYIAAWPLVIGLAAGSMLNACTGSVGYMLLMTGYQRLSFINSIAAVITNVALGIILTPRYGAMGTAVSTGLAIVVMNLMRVLQVRILLKMHPYRWDVFKPIGAGLLSAVPVGVILFLLSHIKSSFTIGHALISFQLLLIPLFLACYIGLLILFKGSPEDEIVLKAIRKKLRRGKGKGKGKNNGKNKQLAAGINK
jgi:O-antigen/teichoic acid export membrane protein